MVVAGKTIAAKRYKPESDSERERVRKSLRKTKILKVSAVVILIGALGFLSVRAFQEWYKWATTRVEVVEIPKEPSVEVIDERTGKRAELSTKMKELIADLEEEFTAQGYKVVRARIPADKTREIDLEIEGFSGVVKVSSDRNAAVSAEDGARMLKYVAELAEDELPEEGKIEYIDVRVERKGYWK